MKAYSITNSLQLIQTEKMVIILKELEHIKNILNFFNGYKEYDNQAYENKPMKKNIYYLLHDIEALEEKISTLKQIQEEMSTDTLSLFLMKYDYIRTQIEDLLGVVHALYNKMQQLFGETLNQYLPYPVLGRRFSNNGIMMYLNNYYREMLKTFSSPKNEEDRDQLVLGWNFKTGFKYRIFVNREIKREGYKGDAFNNYIDLPYWYYELPMLLPSITHEVASIALRRPNEFIERPYQNLKKELNIFFTDTNNNFVQKVHDIIGYKQYADELAREIMCDVMAFHVHKEAYIHAVFHNIIAEKLSKDYLKIIHKEGKEHLKIIPNEWFFNQKKDHAILRLHFLLYLMKDKKSTSYQNMMKILNNLMPLNTSIEEGFSKTYKYSYPNFNNSYSAVQNYLMQTINILKQWHTKNNNSIKNLPTPDKETSPSFKKLWKERYAMQFKEKNHVLHQNNFRREIHRKISALDFLSDENIKNTPIICILELGKVRKDVSINKSQKTDIMKLIEDEISFKEESNKNKKFSVYGIYDWVTIKEKETSIDIVKKLDSMLSSAKHKKVIKLRYFTAKQVLLKIHQEIEGNQKNLQEHTFSVIYNIELEKNVNKIKCTNGYKNLDASIKYIVQILTSSANKSKYKRANIYKSLGPKDLTLILENSSLDFIFNFISQLNKVPQEVNGVNILRTFSMICSPFDSLKACRALKFIYPFTLVSYLRISNTFTNDDLETLIKSKKAEIKSLYEVTGVMDYRLEWKENIEMQTVLDFYNEMIEGKCLTDFQTKIEKKENILDEL